jgi:uncharacterized protein YjiS (DUF1127 family)
VAAKPRGWLADPSNIEEILMARWFRAPHGDGADRAPDRLFAVLTSLALWPLRVAAARATLRQLAALDARALADIGLRPADLNDATALPLAAEPGQFLAARAIGRRIAKPGLGGRPRPVRRRLLLAKTGS